MSSNEVSLVDILKDAYKKFTKEVQNSNAADDHDDSPALSNISHYLEVFQCCITGLSLTIDTSKTSTAAALSESMYIIDLKKNFGDFSDVAAIASNKDILSTIKKLSKLKKELTISDEVKRIREVILSQFNEYIKPFAEESIKVSPPGEPPKTTRHLRRSRLSISPMVPFGRIFDQFVMFVSGLYKLYSDIEPVSLDELSERVKAFIDACRSGKFASDATSNIINEADDVAKRISTVVDELLFLLSDDVSESDEYDHEMSCDDELIKVDSEMSTDSLSAEMSRGSRDYSEPSSEGSNHNDSEVKIDSFVDYTSYNDKKKCEKLAKDLLADPKKLDGINDIDALKGIITGLMQMVRENDAMCSCKYKDKKGDPFEDGCCDSLCGSDDTVLAVVVPRGFVFPEISKKKKKKKKKSKKGKKAHLKSTLNDYSVSESGTMLTNTNIDDRSLVDSPAMLTSSGVFGNDPYFRKLSSVTKSVSEIGNINSGRTLKRISSRGTYNTLTRSTFLTKAKYESANFFRLEPSIVSSLIDGANQRGGVEFLCGSLYSYLMSRFVSLRVSLPSRYGGSPEEVFSHHSSVISEFYKLTLHTFKSVYEISAALNFKDSSQTITMAGDVQKNLSDVVDLLSNFYLEVLSECLAASWIKYSANISTEMENIMGGIRKNKFFDAYSWYDKYSSKVKRSLWEKERIIKRFKVEIISNIERLCNMLVFFSMSISRLPSCSTKFSTGVIYEAVAWGISFSAIVKEIAAKYDTIVKLLSEPDTLVPPTVSLTTTVERIEYLRRCANVSEPTLYRELEIEHELMKNRIYIIDDDGMPRRASLNKLVITATDPKTPAWIREKVGDTIVCASPLLAKSHGAVLASLMDRFCVPESFIEKYGNEYVSAIKRNTIRLIKRWVEIQIDYLDEPLLNILEVFINSDIMASYGSDANMLGEVVYRCKFIRDKMLEISVLPSIRGFDFECNTYSLLDVFDGYSGKRIADQMTLATFKLFKKIKLNELCYKALGSDYYEYEYQNLNRFVCHQNCITSIIGLYVASKSTPRDREVARTRVVDLMNSLRGNNNFSDLFSVYLAYESLYGDEDHGEIPVIKECKEMFDLKSFSKYQRVFSKAPDPKIPLIIDFIRQSILSHEKMDLIEPVDNTGLSEELRSVGQLDFEDIRKRYEAIWDMWSVRGGSYRIAMNPSLYRIFYEPPRFVIGSEIDFWNLKKGKAIKNKHISKTLRQSK